MDLEFRSMNIKMYLNPSIRSIKADQRQKSSVGLGLAISQDIINSHGGKIRLDKSRMGGLKLRVFLPF